MATTTSMAAKARVLGHPVRLGVLRLLSGRPMIVTELTEELGTEPTSLSKHLSVLRESGLVACDHQWRCRKYSLNDPGVVRALLGLLERLAGEEK